MKNRMLYLAVILMTTFLPLVLMSADPTDGGTANDCDARCSILEGEGKYRCLKTCINTRKRNAPVGENRVKRKINECEKTCESYRGIDNITCRRLCLDNKRYVSRQKSEPAAKENQSPCEARCGVLTGPTKDNCIARCEKKSRFDSRGSSGK